MYPHDRLAASKAKNSAFSSVRNKLQIAAQKASSEVASLMTPNASKEDLVRAKAIAETYVSIRQALTPDVASDGYTNTLAGKAKLAQKRILEIADSPPNI
jgi:hypothetical protein